MKYIIMCGGEYQQWEIPRQLSVVKGEELVERTIRLLRENGVEDIAISSNNPIFEKFNVPVLKHDNLYIADKNNNVEGDWFNCFYPTNKPTCYIFGDVYFSNAAIKTIVETKTDDMEFFGSMPPFADNYIKTHEEPFALKVVNTKHLKEAIKKARKLNKENKFWRKPIMWELWTVIKNAPLQTKADEYTTDYIVINDYTCDIDRKEDAALIEKAIDDITFIKDNIGDKKMIKLEAIIDFSLEKFDKLKNIKRYNENENEYKQIYMRDIYECDRKTAEYLLGNNAKRVVTSRVIEIIPEKR